MNFDPGIDTPIPREPSAAWLWVNRTLFTFFVDFRRRNAALIAEREHLAQVLPKRWWPLQQIDLKNPTVSDAAIIAARQEIMPDQQRFEFLSDLLDRIHREEWAVWLARNPIPRGIDWIGLD